MMPPPISAVPPAFPSAPIRPSKVPLTSVSVNENTLKFYRLALSVTAVALVILAGTAATPTVLLPLVGLVTVKSILATGLFAIPVITFVELSVKFILNEWALYKNENIEKKYQAHLTMHNQMKRAYENGYTQRANELNAGNA